MHGCVISVTCAISSGVVYWLSHQGREIIAIVPLENGAFCTVFSENFHKF
jgi:hypothetical protein